MATQTDSCMLYYYYYYCHLNPVIAPIFHLLCLCDKMQENRVVESYVQMPVTNLQSEFPYLKIQDKVNFLRWSLELPMLGRKNAKDGDYSEWIMCLPSAGATSA